MSSSAEPLNLLSYASRSKHNRWGPFLFKPSRRSVVLLALLAAVIGWLAVRHAPWRSIGDIQTNPTLEIVLRGPDFVPACNGMIVRIPRQGVFLIDLATALPIRRIGNTSDEFEQYAPTSGGRRVFAFKPGDPTIRLYDSISGALVNEFKNPASANGASFQFSPDGSRLITGDTSQAAPSAVGYSVSALPDVYQIWDLSKISQSASPVRIGGLSEIVAITFSGDGSRLLIRKYDDVEFLDSADLHSVFSQPRPNSNTIFRTIGNQTVGIDNAFGGQPELRSTVDGALIDSRSGIDLSAWISPNLQYLIKPNSNRLSLDLFDRKSSRVIFTFAPGVEPLSYFPTSDRVLAISSQSEAVELWDFRHDSPLAILLPESEIIWACPSPDGQTIVASLGNRSTSAVPVTEGYRIFHKTGWDCPESPIGMFAFSHFWLLLVLLIGSTVSLLADARRQAAASGVYQPHPILLVGLCAVGLVLSFHFIVEACLNEWIRTPALLLLVASIGLAGGSRIWRLITLILLCGVLAWCCFYFAKVQSMAFENSYWIFDRVRQIPQQFRLAILTLAIAGCLLAIILLSLRQREEAL